MRAWSPSPSLDHTAACVSPPPTRCRAADAVLPGNCGYHLQVLLVGLYLLLCVLYWAWSALQLVAELRDVLDVKHFINNKLGISDRQVRAAPGVCVCSTI